MACRMEEHHLWEMVGEVCGGGWLIAALIKDLPGEGGAVVVIITTF